MSTEIKEQVEILNNSLGFKYLREKAAEIQAKCKDYIVTNLEKNMLVTDTGKLHFRSVHNQNGKYHFSEHALGQYCTKLGVPTRYIKKCIEKGELELVANNLNTWSDRVDTSKSLLLRTYEEKVRGVLTDKFSILDTPDIIEGLSQIEGYKLKGLMLNEERFHARLIQPEPLPIPEEDLFAGIQIDSSDVGRSILKVQFFIHKLVCSNGLTIEKAGGILFEQKHIGISPEVFKKKLHDSIDSIPSIVARLTGDIVNAKSLALTDLYINQIIKGAKNTLELSDSASESVLHLVEHRYGKTKWGVVNSLTEVAQKFSLERRLQIEAFAGELLVA